MAAYAAYEAENMNTTAIAIFVKTPELSPVKTRLAATIGTEKALAFYSLSLRAVQETVKNVKATPYWALAEEDGLANPLWSEFNTLWTGEGNLGERQHHVYESLLLSHKKVILIGADAPQISENILEKAISDLSSNDFVVGPARDGGYYLFGGKTPLRRDIWASVPWSTSSTRQCLESALPAKPAHLAMLTDVDTEDDLTASLQEMPSLTSEPQRQLVEWIENL